MDVRLVGDGLAVVGYGQVTQWTSAAAKLRDHLQVVLGMDVTCVERLPAQTSRVVW